MGRKKQRKDSDLSLINENKAKGTNNWWGFMKVSQIIG